METDFECGVVGQFNALIDYGYKITWEQFLRVWGWKNYNDYRDNFSDQPGNHVFTLKKLKVPFRRVKINEVIRQTAPVNRTIVLFHRVIEGSPLAAYTDQHWARYIGFDVTKGKYIFDWGRGKDKCFSAEYLKEMYEAGSPDYAYCIGEHEPSLSVKFKNWFWLQWQTITKKILK